MQWFNRSNGVRWGLLVLCGLAYLPAGAAEPIDPSQATFDKKQKVLWYNAKLLDIEGQAWNELKSPYDRLPAKAEKMVRPAVWSLSHDTAGILVRFRTDATTIKARWTLTSPSLAMPHMAATGVSGLDLYVKFEGDWRWLAVGKPGAQTNTVTLISNIPAGTRDYMLYLPLYNGVRSLEIGIPKSSHIMKPDSRPEGHRKPIVFYGTSITQGGCASRTGMVHTAILGRRFNRPVINLGFSGNGEMEPELAKLIAEIDAAVYVIDCLPNMNAKQVTARTAPLVHILREKRPQTPILLVEDRNYTNGFLVTSRRERNVTNQAALSEEFKKLQQAGVSNLYYLPADDLLGDDGEGTVDSSHPTDLGFMRQANAFAEALGPILDGP